MNVDDYVRALDVELRDQPRHVRRAESSALREHLGELPAGALDELDDPASYAREYRAQRGLRTKKFIGAWRRFSWPQRTATFVVVVLLIAAVVIPTAIAHYQPITVNVDMSAGGSALSHQDPHGDGTIYEYREGATLTLGMEFANPSRFAATITSLPDVGELGPLQLQRVAISSIPYSFGTGEAATTFPFRIPAHTSRTVLLTFRLSTCKFGAAGQSAGGSMGIVQIFFTMKILGVHHSLVAPLTGFQKIWVDFPNHATLCTTNGST
jgi:hypothetical protein